MPCQSDYINDIKLSRGYTLLDRKVKNCWNNSKKEAIPGNPNTKSAKEICISVKKTEQDVTLPITASR